MPKSTRDRSRSPMNKNHRKSDHKRERSRSPKKYEPGPTRSDRFACTIYYQDALHGKDDTTELSDFSIGVSYHPTREHAEAHMRTELIAEISCFLDDDGFDPLKLDQFNKRQQAYATACNGAYDPITFTLDNFKKNSRDLTLNDSKKEKDEYLQLKPETLSLKDLLNMERWIWMNKGSSISTHVFKYNQIKLKPKR
jgi:hypothetical protein